MRRYVLLFWLVPLVFLTGCLSSRVIEDSRIPEITIASDGTISFNDKQLRPGKIASALRSAGFRKTQEINILIPENPDRAVMRSVSAELVRSGYTRTVFVKTRKAMGTVGKPQ